jgi:TnpA family transposase
LLKLHGTKDLSLENQQDDETMRQRIHQQLVKGESFNSLSSAIHYGNSGKIIYASKEDLLLLEGSKRLLENVVICWNYLYLTRSLVKATPKERKEIIVKSLKYRLWHGSILIFKENLTSMTRQNVMP